MIMILTVFNFGFQTYQTGSSVFECRENKPSGKLKALTNEVLRPVHEIVLLVLNFSLPLFLILLLVLLRLCAWVQQDQAKHCV